MEHKPWGPCPAKGNGIEECSTTNVHAAWSQPILLHFVATKQIRKFAVLPSYISGKVPAVLGKSAVLLNASFSPPLAIHYSRDLVSKFHFT